MLRRIIILIAIAPAFAFLLAGCATSPTSPTSPTRTHTLIPCDTDADCAAKNPWVGDNFMEGEE